MVNIAGVTLSKANADKLAAEAMRVAKDEGYCDEVINILEQMGFDVPEPGPITVTLTVEIDDLGRGFDPATLERAHFSVDFYHDGSTGYDAWADLKAIKVEKK